jgi:hypothetical protein
VILECPQCGGRSLLGTTCQDCGAGVPLFTEEEEARIERHEMDRDPLWGPPDDDGRRLWGVHEP